MRPFLLVGCGGSGGVTLQFMMDQLAADLSARGVHQLPAAWQFVHIDVPLTPDGGGADMPPVLGGEAGGHYVHLAPQASNYSAVLASVGEQLMAQNRYSQLATWVANPAEAPVELSQGAGQMRAVGRVVTLSRLGKVREGLQRAIEIINGPEAQVQLDSLSRILGTGSDSQSGNKPLVVVVSSMAGGAGASMVLDVCRLLSHMQNIAADSIALFLYTPEIFDSVPEHERRGVPGNALATMNELMATQLGAATRDDDELFAALGMGVAHANRGIPFRRVFPIGAFVGDSGAKFGDGNLTDIYRGVGRGLAALMLSGEATKSWASYDLVNVSGFSSRSADFAWGGVETENQWGSFGFAQLSMGRDRFREYAAQRLARSAVLRLTQGHYSPHDPATDPEQLDRVTRDRTAGFLQAMQLPGIGENMATWYERSFSAEADAVANRVFSERIAADLGTAAGNAKSWVDGVTGKIIRKSAELSVQVQAEGYALMYRFYEELLVRTEQVVSAVIATDGLPVAIKLVTRLQRELDQWVTATRDGAARQRIDASLPPVAPMQKVAAIGGNIDPRHPVIAEFRAGYIAQTRMAVDGASLQVLVDVLISYKNDELEPLLRALSETSATLNLAVKSTARTAGLAQLRTDSFGEWPTEDDKLVPARFTRAQNEVLLVNAEQFPGEFVANLLASQSTGGATVSVTEATAVAVRQIISDRWETTDTLREGQLLIRRATWRPSSMSRVPGKDDSAPTGAAVYRVAALPAELLERARNWIDVPNAPFDKYISTSLRSYVDGAGVSDFNKAQFTQEISTKFRVTLELAQPLVGINQTMVSAMHGMNASVSYKFSEVPFGGLPLGDELIRSLTQGSAETTSVRRLTEAMRVDSNATRIDVFSSYAPLAPLAFSSLLRPLAEGWANANLPETRKQFWSLRRSRRLAGAVAMGDKQRQAVIGGWYLARFTGRLRWPGESQAVETVQVYDQDGQRAWLSFPDPLIVTKLELDRSKDNYLPAVLMSYGLALAKASASGSMEPLRPYTVLRTYWDESVSGIADFDDHSVLTAGRHVSQWLGTRVVPKGAPASRDTPSLGDPEQDRKALLTEIENIRRALGTDYLRPGEAEGAPGGGRYSQVTRSQDIWGVPLFHEVARDAYIVLGILGEIVAEAPVGTGGPGSSNVGLSG